MDKLLGCVQMVANMLLRDEKPARAEAAEELKAVAAEVQAKLATRDQQVAEACAEAVDRMPLRHTGRADLTANQAVETIRSGEWKLYMKGVE